MIAYAGPFTPEFRGNLVELWQSRLKELKIPHTPGCDVKQTMSTPVTVLLGLFSSGATSRSFVRQSWGKQLPRDFRMWFLGSVPTSGGVPSDVWLERRAHADLLLFTTIREAYSSGGIYSSLPLKALMALILYEANRNAESKGQGLLLRPTHC